VERAGRLRIQVVGPSPGELRYQPDRSATVIDGAIVFVCLDGGAYDGQSGFEQIPGAWSCGTEALVRGFRQMGQPLDAWSPELESDEGIEESVAVAEDGTWRWEYGASSPLVGGEVRASLVLDPASGQIRSASRTDPTGSTTYTISYSEPFPPIVLP